MDLIIDKSLVFFGHISQTCILLIYRSNKLLMLQGYKTCVIQCAKQTDGTDLDNK